MDPSTKTEYRALNEAQNVIRRANTLGQAMREGLRVIEWSCNARATDPVW